ncbi:hypothetical protein [Roseicella aquatilis]|uniref:Uncharacterized protein n=1 Tax=Roseicella aquatilis TaxID=2527868 RepID=A0A4V2WKH7_9PROT|nr:hypothetical protein [Roseicella aquatilis]TCZ58604.1 hypothetical protein EXY23_16855 [Roseicella aquatilis]
MEGSLSVRVAPRTATALETGRLDLDAALGHAAPDRLTILVLAYLLAPVLLFLGGWTAAWAGALLVPTALAALAAAPGWRGPWPLRPRAGLACLGFGLLWAVGATGTHHLLHAAADWQIRDAVLLDLAAGRGPVAYKVDGQAWLLRAPLGYYMPAALVGRLLGPAAAEAALWAWTGLGLALALALLACLARRIAPRRRPWIAVAVTAGLFTVFGGLDILPNVWLDWRAGAGPLASWGRGGDWWARLFQYSGHVTLLLWAPNHAMPAWLGALLLLRHGFHPRFARAAALPLVAGAFWSPLAAFGAAVLTLPAVLRGGLRPALRAALAPANLLSLLVALPVCLYLTAGSDRIPHGPLFWKEALAWALQQWLLLLAVEVLAWAGFAWLAVRGRLLAAAVAMLCLLPLYVFGPGNEMTMRGGMAPIAVLSVAAAAGLLAPAPGRWQRVGRAGLLACALLAALGSAMEASLVVAHPPWPASRDCSLPEAARQSVFDHDTDWSHYVVRWPDPVLEAWMAPPAPRPVHPDSLARCWPGG